MGKSNKKVKYDRINAIRKQYDAFLEEDKKRRERNEYILGKLDKMRSSTALVPISSKANYHMELNPSQIYIRPKNLTKLDTRDSYVSCLEKQDVTGGMLSNPVEELRILKEISKKYILIPKRTPIDKDYVYSKDVVDDDWKTKYNILEDLKKLEKDDQSDPVFKQCNDDNNIYNKKLDFSMDSNIIDKQTPNLSNDPNKFEIPVSDKNIESTTADKLNKPFNNQDKDNRQVHFNISEINSQDTTESKIPLQIEPLSSNEVKIHQTESIHDATIQENVNNPLQQNVSEKEKYNSESNEKDLNVIENVNNNLQTCEISDINQRTVFQENPYPSDSNTPKAEPNIYKASLNIKADEAAAITDQTISDVNETGTAEYSKDTVHQDRNIDNQIDTSDMRDLTATERVELYDDIDNNPEGQIVTNETTSDQPTYYDPAQNTVPVDLENIQQGHVESEINAFEAEQKEMFYSEQTHADPYPYNQNEGNTGEYTDGYEQNDQFAYYEGVQQQEAYATNINEHEESTERYDPHYNQQYEGSYENQQPDNTVNYEDTTAYEQQQLQGENPQFENVANYENQQENVHLYQQENVSNETEVKENVLLPQDEQMYDQHLYAEQPDTQALIEQQLITEEGYIESAPVIPDGFQKENEDKNENVIDTTPDDPMPEPKLA